MRKLLIITALFIVGLVGELQAQFTQIELFSGFKKTNFNFFSLQPINDNNTLNVSLLTFFEEYRDEHDQDFDELGVQPTLFWNISEHISIGPSLYYNSVSGYSERLSAKFTLKRSQLLFVLMPTIACSEQTGRSYVEAFTQFQLNKPLNDKISIWFNGQFLTVWNEFKSHSRSFQQLRLGVSLKGHQLGIGFDFDQYGPKPNKRTSFGLYYRNIL